MHNILMSSSILFAWIGNTDLRASRDELGGKLGPIGQAVSKGDFTHVALLSNYTKKESRSFAGWIKQLTSAEVKMYPIKLTSPTHHGEIYEAALSTINNVKKILKLHNPQVTFHISPGTPAMASIWILLAKTIQPAELIESSPEKGVEAVDVPFDISADYLPNIISSTDNKLVRLMQGLPPEAPEFDSIIHRCKLMKKVIAKSRLLAHSDEPVLIQGESGTGKELFARAIHKASDRSGKAFIPVNCGAIPEDLVEAEFFGHKKGAFTGAASDRAGYFEEANSGTIFLDEIGELPLQAQVKLLRALQEGTITRLGTNKPVKIDVRLITATNRNLIGDVSSGYFRKDLFYRIAVGILHIPSLLERQGDLNPLIEHIIEDINKQFKARPGWIHKKISVGARNLIHQHTWPGNIRELKNTLTRASIWTLGDTITAEDIQDALFPAANVNGNDDNILNNSIGNGFSLPSIVTQVVRHYLIKALKESKGNKTEAAKLVGLSSYQTFTNWMEKYKVKS